MTGGGRGGRIRRRSASPDTSRASRNSRSHAGPKSSWPIIAKSSSFGSSSSSSSSSALEGRGGRRRNRSREFEIAYIENVLGIVIEAAILKDAPAWKDKKESAQLFDWARALVRVMRARCRARSVCFVLSICLQTRIDESRSAQLAIRFAHVVAMSAVAVAVRGPPVSIAPSILVIPGARPL